MPRSPLYKAPKGVDTDTQGLAGYEPCGCITAAKAITAECTEAAVRHFYSDMAETGREVRWTDDDVIRARLFHPCEDQHPVAA